jgi:hypothetical protein
MISFSNISKEIDSGISFVGTKLYFGCFSAC